MKKILLGIFCGLLVCALWGCGEKEEITTPAPFSGKDWSFLDPARGSHDRISFGEDGSFSYYCDAGEPVGDSDLYDSYRYDGESSLITLYNGYDKNEKTVRVLSYNVSHLLLEIDGEIRDFSTDEVDTVSNFWWMEAEAYLGGYALNRTVVGCTQDTLTTAAVNYDSETDYPKDTLETFPLAEDAVYFDLSLFSQREVADDLENEISYELSYDGLSPEDLQFYMDQGGATAYLWLNEDMEIEKVVIFGMTSLTE